MDKTGKISTFSNLNGSLINCKILKNDKSFNITLKHLNQSNLSGWILLMVAVFNFLGLWRGFLPFPAVVLVLLIFTVYLYSLIFGIKQENLSYIHGVGYQISTTYVLASKTRFIPCEKVQQIFINEVIYQKQVLFVLTFLTKDNKLIPLFMESKLRLHLLQILYKLIYTNS